ncbi:class II aldolase/adducin family protein [bacterium]|nr:class II aldolase/adducin family protein [bacterium]
MKNVNIKKQLVEIGKKIADKGLVVGPGGNISARVGNIVYMKASGISFEEAKVSDYIGVDLKTGKIVDGSKKPTCEIAMHLGCYLERKDVSAVIHTHPPIATAVGMQEITLRPFTPDLAALAGDVPTIKYVVPGGRELAEEVRNVIKKHNAILMCNHGLLTVGSSLREAYYRTLLVEDACKTFVAAKSLGEMKFFTRKQVEQINNLKAESYRKALLKKA